MRGISNDRQVVVMGNKESLGFHAPRLKAITTNVAARRKYKERSPDKSISGMQ